MSILTFYDDAAMQLAASINRVPEIATDAGWVTATSQGAARRVLSADNPQGIRLRIGDRVLLEDILQQAIPVDTVLADLLATLDPTTLTSDQTQALALYKANTP